jgi:hypothetical protein
VPGGGWSVCAPQSPGGGISAHLVDGGFLQMPGEQWSQHRGSGRWYRAVRCNVALSALIVLISIVSAWFHAISQTGLLDPAAAALRLLPPGGVCRCCVADRIRELTCGGLWRWRGQVPAGCRL